MKQLPAGYKAISTMYQTIRMRRGEERGE